MRPSSSSSAWSSPRLSRALPRAPGRNLGLGREFGHAPSPNWATTLAQSTSVVGSNRTAARRLRTNEKRRRRLPSETLSHFLFCSLSLFAGLRSLFFPQCRHSSHRASEWAKQWSSEPRRRRRPPRRRARSPVGERAAVERPGHGPLLASLFFSRAGEGPARLFFSRAGEGPVRVGFFSLPFLLPLVLFDLVVLLLSELMWGIGIGLGVSYADPRFSSSFCFPNRRVHPNRIESRSRVRVRFSFHFISFLICTESLFSPSSSRVRVRVLLNLPNRIGI